MKVYTEVNDVMLDTLAQISCVLTAGVFVRYTVVDEVVSLEFRDMECDGSESKQILLSSDALLSNANKHGVKKLSSILIVDIVYHLSKNCWLIN